MYKLKTRLENTKFLSKSKEISDISKDITIYSLDENISSLLNKQIFSSNHQSGLLLCQKDYFVYRYSQQMVINVVDLYTNEKKELEVGDTARVYKEKLIGKVYNSDYSRVGIKIINLRTGEEGFYDDISDYTLRFYNLEEDKLLVGAKNENRLICYEIIDEKNLEEKWFLQLNEGIRIGCFLGELRGEYLFTLNDGRVLYLDKVSGQCKGEIKPPENHVMPAIHVLDQIQLDLVKEEIFYLNGDYLYEIDLRDKFIKVTNLKVKDFPEKVTFVKSTSSADEDYIYALGIYNEDIRDEDYDDFREFYLYILDRRTFEIKWEYHLPKFKLHNRGKDRPVVEGDELYFEFDANLYIFEKDSAVPDDNDA